MNGECYNTHSDDSHSRLTIVQRSQLVAPAHEVSVVGNADHAMHWMSIHSIIAILYHLSRTRELFQIGLGQDSVRPDTGFSG